MSFDGVMKLVEVIRALRREGRWPLLLVLLAGMIWAGCHLYRLSLCSFPIGLAASWNLAAPDLVALGAFLGLLILSLWRYWTKIEFESLHPHLWRTRDLVIKALNGKDAPSPRYLLAELEARSIALKKLGIRFPDLPISSDDLQGWSEFLNKVTEHSSLGMLKKARGILNSK